MDALPEGAMVIAWKPAGLVGAETVKEPGAMTWNDLLTSDVETAREFHTGLFGWETDPSARAAAALGSSRAPTAPTAG
jgi:hypothetical protein